MNSPDCVPGCHLNLSGEVGQTVADARSVPPAIWLSGGIAVVDGDGKIVSANDSLANWLGALPAELAGRSLPGLIGERHAPWGEQIKDLLARPAAFDRMELAATRNDLTERLSVELCCHGPTRFVRMESGVPPARDLEALFPEDCWGRVAIHHSFQRMLRAEAQLENLPHRWPGIIFSQRPDFSFAFISPRIEELTGVSAQEWRRHSNYFWQVVHEADAKPLMAKLREGARSPAEMTSTYRIRHIKTGRVSYLWEHRQPVRSSNGLLLGYEGIWLDISRQTIAERRLLTMSWKENLGTLTMGLAHDFCNIMTGIVSLSETFQAELGENSSLREGLNLIRTTAIEAGQLTQRIRQLHQGTPGEKNYHDLNEIVSTMAGVLQKVLPRRVRVQTELEQGQLPVYLDQVELRQVIVNLALNAADAMPNGGQLIFHTARHQQVPAVSNVQGTLPRSPVVSLSVQDTGTGISPSVLNSIFDPFFTTKPLGKGSGLGLYNARLFAEEHNAAISIESKEKTGTTFHFWFPEADFTEADAVEIPEPIVRHTLLAVGPAEDTVNRIADQLRENGYYVATAASEAGALEHLHSPHFQFSGLVLICASGPREHLALVDQVRAEKLPLRTFCLLNCNQDELETDFLQKADAVLPFDTAMPELLARLKSVLESPFPSTA